MIWMKPEIRRNSPGKHFQNGRLADVHAVSLMNTIHNFPKIKG